MSVFLSVLYVDLSELYLSYDLSKTSDNLFEYLFLSEISDDLSGLYVVLSEVSDDLYEISDNLSELSVIL